MKYHNPIIRGFHPDPSICYDGNFYYMVTSSFEFFPAVPLHRSKDLINWDFVGHCLTRNSQVDLRGCLPSRGIYAPTIRYHDNTYFLITTDTNTNEQIIVYTHNPMVGWSDSVRFSLGAIDPSLTFIDDRVYFTSNQVVNDTISIGLCEINPFTGEQLSPFITISSGFCGKIPEAPHLYKIGNYYYLLLAEGGTEYGHMATIGRSLSPFGPYESCPYNPILTHRNSTSPDIQCTGHADIFQDKNGNWWSVFLGVRPAYNLLHNLGRETFLAPVIWKDEWPLINNGSEISLVMDVAMEDSTIYPLRCTNFFDDFKTPHFAPQWSSVKGSFESFAFRSDISKILSLKSVNGQAHTLDNAIKTPAFCGIRQTEFDTCATIDVLLNNTVDFCGGLSAFYNDSYHYDIQLHKYREQISINIYKKIHDINWYGSSVILPNSNKITLKITTNRQDYVFSYLIDDDEFTLGQGAVVGLCSETTHSMTFTGVFLGLFCDSGMIGFQNFRYEILNQ